MLSPQYANFLTWFKQKEDCSNKVDGHLNATLAGKIARELNCKKHETCEYVIALSNAHMLFTKNNLTNCNLNIYILIKKMNLAILFWINKIISSLNKH